MRQFSMFLALLGAFGLAGCSKGGSPQAQKGGDPAAAPAPEKVVNRGSDPGHRDQVDADGIVRRGVDLSEGQAVAISAVATKADQLNGQVVKVEGTVGTVCKKKGCWFALQDQAKKYSIRITAKDYGFFVPADAAGMQATIEGELKVAMLDVKTAQHYENDRVEGTDEAPKKIEAPVPEMSIVASALQMKRPQ